MSKPNMRGVARSRFVALGFAVVASLLAVTGCAKATKATTISVPSDFAAQFQDAADNGNYVFYALADAVPTWDSVAQAGIFICSESRPALIPQAELGQLGAYPAGMVVTLNTKDIADLLGVQKLYVTIPAAVDGCTPVAMKQMQDTPGTLMMTDANASFPEQGQMVKVQLNS